MQRPHEMVQQFELVVVESSREGAGIGRELRVLSALAGLDVVTRRRIALVVARCRERGATWSQIGAELGISKQAAQQRYG